MNFKGEQTRGRAVNQIHRLRGVLLLVDGLALVGIVLFSVLAALNRDERIWVVGQIVCAVIVLVSVLLLRWMANHPPVE
jgi:hypothetical protein